MTKYIQKFIFFVTILTFTNVVSATDWPIFSTGELKGDYSVKLDKPFFSVKDIYEDQGYLYKIDHHSPYLSRLTTFTIQPHLYIEMVPLVGEIWSEYNMLYHVYIEGEFICDITINRERQNNLQS